MPKPCSSNTDLSTRSASYIYVCVRCGSGIRRVGVQATIQAYCVSIQAYCRPCIVHVSVAWAYLGLLLVLNVVSVCLVWGCMGAVS